MIVVLKYPYYRDVSEPDIYETATVHTEVGRMNTLDTQSHIPVAVSCFLVRCVLYACVEMCRVII